MGRRRRRPPVHPDGAAETEENYLGFEGAVADGGASYVARAPSGASQTRLYTFGPVEVSDDGTDWRAVEGTDRTVLLVGADD